jgi:hypothetical protein
VTGADLAVLLSKRAASDGIDFYRLLSAGCGVAGSQTVAGSGWRVIQRMNAK